MFYADPDFDKVDCMGKSDAQSHSIAANPYKSTACDRKLANTPDHLLSAKQLQRKRDAEDFKNYSIRAIARYDYNHTYGVIGPRKSFKKFLKRVKRHSKERNLWNPRSVFLNQVDREEAEDKQQDPKEIEIDTWRTENEEEFFIRLQCNEQERKLDLEHLICDACGADLFTASDDESDTNKESATESNARKGSTATTEDICRFVCRHPGCQDPENFYFCESCVETRQTSAFKCLKEGHPLVLCDLHPDDVDLLNSNDPEYLSDLDEQDALSLEPVPVKTAETADADADDRDDVFVGRLDSSKEQEATQNDEAEMNAAIAAARPLSVPMSFPPPPPPLPPQPPTPTLPKAMYIAPRVLPKMSVKERLAKLDAEYASAVADMSAPPSATTKFTQTLTTTVVHPVADPPVFKSMADVSKALSKPSYVIRQKTGIRAPMKRPAATSSTATAAPPAKRQKTDGVRKTST